MKKSENLSFFHWMRNLPFQFEHTKLEQNRNKTQKSKKKK